MKTVYLKTFQRKKYFLLLILLLSLFLICSFYKMVEFLKNTRSTKKSNNPILVYVPVKKSKDPIDVFKSKLYRFGHMKNPCWYQPPLTSENMINEMKKFWKDHVISKEIPTPNMTDILINIWTSLFLQKQSKFRCFPYFYILSSNKCIRNEIVNFLTQVPEIKAPNKIDIDFWPNFHLDNIDSYAHYFESPSMLIAEDNFLITFDASSSTFFQPNMFFHSKGPLYSTPDFIHALNANVKILVFIQNPVTKLYADYMSEESKSNTSTFHEKVIQSIYMFKKCLKMSRLVECIYNKRFTKTYPVSLHLGIYWVFLERWCRKFSTNKIKLFPIEDYFSCQDCFLKHILSFLLLSDLPKIKNIKVDAFFNCLYPKLPMLEKTKKILKEFYYPYNKKLVKISRNMDFHWQ